MSGSQLRRELSIPGQETRATPVLEGEHARPKQAPCRAPLMSTRARRRSRVAALAALKCCASCCSMSAWCAASSCSALHAPNPQEHG
jgi:hypothetical protein